MRYAIPIITKRKTVRVRIIGFWLTCFVILPLITASAAFSQSTPGAILQKDTLPAVGRQETVLAVSTFGRYAVTVQSPQGTAIQLVDKQTGPGKLHGIAGRRDGRLDIFLDRGRYKIVIYSPEKGSGKVSLTAHGFNERNVPRPPRLIRHKIVATRLTDFQQRSYWIEVKKRRTVAIEAAGRSLQELRLWKDGTWLVNMKPARIILEPKKEEPLTSLRLAGTLNPGLYLLSAYGGPSHPWASASTDKPLFIRMGIPKLGNAGEHHFVAGPFGTDRWLVTQKADFYQLTLPLAGSASIRVSPHRPHKPFAKGGVLKKITKKSKTPEARIKTSSRSSGYNLVTVKQDAGKTYTLQFFKRTRRSRIKIKGSGDHFITTIHSGYGEDSVDTTAILVERPPSGHDRIIHKQIVKLGPEAGFKRRFNLLGPMTLFLGITQKGPYVVSCEGASARFLLVPFFTRKPKDYSPPDPKPSGHTWELEAGIYVLIAEPLAKGRGIATLSLLPQRSPAHAQIKYQPVMTASRFSSVKLNSRNTYYLYLNHQPGVEAGVVIRRLPVNLKLPLPVSQEAGKLLELPVTIPETGYVTALSAGGHLLGIGIDNRSAKKKQRLNAGRHRLKIPNPDNSPLRYQLLFTPIRLAPGIPLPLLTEAALKKLPDFPDLSQNKPLFFDIARRERRSFQVRVDSPALYRLESTGLLHTEGNLRTRIHPTLDRRTANGSGSNFLIQQYLRQGEYQLTTRSKGKTRGHMGIRLSRTKLHDGGNLTMGSAARFFLPTGEGLFYRFHIPKTGRYRFRALGMDRKFHIRMEDSDGWPVVTPNRAGNLIRRFSRGDYRVVILPQSVDARVVSLLEPITAEAQYKGHGPHRLLPHRMGQQIFHRWMEPEPGKERIPDQWSFRVPAPLDASLELSQDMSGELHFKPEEGQALRILSIGPHKLWSGRLAKGEYVLLLKGLRKNNRLDYSFTVSFKQLAPGFRRQITAPADIPIAIGDAGLVEISSFGDRDVRARLFDALGNRLAQNDDRTHDWNFLLTPNLKAGFYRLQVEPVGEASAKTLVSLYSPRIQTETTLVPPARWSVRDNHLHQYPLKLSQTGDLLLIAADCRDNVRLILQKKNNAAWKDIGQASGTNPFLAMALGADSLSESFRLQVVNVDRRGAPIHLKTFHHSPQLYPEKEFVQKGIFFNPVPEITPAIGTAAVKLESAGVFRFEAAGHAMKWTCKTPGILSRPNTAVGPVVASRDTLWLLDGITQNHSRRIRAERLKLTPEKKVNLTLAPGQHAFLDLETEGRGPRLLLAQSRIDQPGIALRATSAEKTVSYLHMGVADRSAVAVDIKSQMGVAEIWNAGHGHAPLPVNLHLYSLTPPETRTVYKGFNDIRLKPQASVACALPPGAKRLHVTLPPATAAVFFKGGTIQKVHWSGDKAFTQLTDQSADRLVLLHTGRSDTLAGVTYRQLQSTETRLQLSSSTIFKRYLPARGSISVDVVLSDKEKKSGALVNIYGPEVEATLLERNGRIIRGKRLAVSDNAHLDMRHGPGLVVAWLESAAYSPWEAILSDDRVNTVSIEAPGSIPLKGHATLLRFNSKEARMLHLGIEIPVIAYIETGALAPRIEIYPNAAAPGLFLPAGDSLVLLQPVSEGVLGGWADVSFSKIIPLGEGAGPTIRMPPGGCRLFSFTLPHDGPVGVGVKASADVALCRLMDKNGKILGRNMVQMPHLVKGSYLLAVETPVESMPVEIQPVVVGIDLPDTGPPADVVHQYLKMAGLELEGRSDQEQQ